MMVRDLVYIAAVSALQCSLALALPEADGQCLHLFSLGGVNAQMADRTGAWEIDRVLKEIRSLRLPPSVEKSLIQLARHPSTRKVSNYLLSRYSPSEIESIFTRNLNHAQARTVKEWAHFESTASNGTIVHRGLFGEQLQLAIEKVRVRKAELAESNNERRGEAQTALAAAQKRQRVIEDQIVHFKDQVELLKRFDLFTPELEAALAFHDLGKVMPASLNLQAHATLGLLKLALGRIDPKILSDPQLLPPPLRDKVSKKTLDFLEQAGISAEEVIQKADGSQDPLTTLRYFGLLLADGTGVVLPLRNFIGEGLAHSWNTLDYMMAHLKGPNGRLDPVALRVLLLGIGHDQFYIRGSFGFSNFKAFMGMDSPRLVMDEARPINLTDRVTISTLAGLRKLLSEDVSIENALKAFRGNEAQADWNERNFVQGDFRLQQLITEARDVDGAQRALFEATVVTGNAGAVSFNGITLRFQNVFEFAGVGGDASVQGSSIAEQFFTWYYGQKKQ